MSNSNLSTEKHDLLITPHLTAGQLPTQLEQALSVAPEGEMRDMLLLSLLTNCAYALPAMRMLHGRPHHTYSPELLTMIVAPAASGKGIMNYGRLLLIGHKLLMHAAMVFQMMPELKSTPMGEIGGNMLQRQFFQMLPTDVLSRLRTRTIAPQSRRQFSKRKSLE